MTPHRIMIDEGVFIMKIVFLERNSVGEDVDVSCFNQFGDVEIHTDRNQEETAEWIKDADIVLLNKTQLNEANLSGAKKLKMIGEMATGFDNIDIHYCKEHNIAVCNVGSYSTMTVVQLTFALALSLLMKIPYYDEYVKSGKYADSNSFAHFANPIYELDGKTWGILGMGNIGNRVKKVAEAFGCKVINAPVSDRPLKEGEVDIETLLKDSDVVSLHCPLSERSMHLINKDTLALMKSTAILINMARGKCVDENALYDALIHHTIAGAGLDVLEEEPMSKENPLLKIQDSNQLLITPHMGWASVEARERDVEITKKNIDAFLKGEKLNRIV